MNSTECGIDDETGAICLPDLTGLTGGYVGTSITEKVITALLKAGPSQTADQDQKKPIPVVGSSFPFTLEDLAYWVVRRKDGTVLKYIVVGEQVYRDAHKPADGSTYAPAIRSTPPSTTPTTSYGAWCKHDPVGEPIWNSGDHSIFIADAPGMRGFVNRFDLVLDCGQIFKLETVQNAPVLTGDEEIARKLGKYALITSPRILKIDWDDRSAPPLDPQFWVDLVGMIKGLKVCTACQGGHGRSGSSLVCMMMALNPEYTPFDAIVHLRAMHCGRAIESKVQHEYLNEVGAHLGREQNAFAVSKVTDFKKEFLSLKLKSARPYQKRLNGEMDLKKAGTK